MSSHRDTLSRLWLVLRSIPRYPQKITVQSLCLMLSSFGLDVTERTLQRDLISLSGLFPLVSDDREKPYGWSWQQDAKSFDLPGLTADEALTWVLAEQHIGQMLPQSTFTHLRPYFKAAHERLNSESQPQRARSWLSKVRTVSPMQPLIPPVIDAEVQSRLSDALLRERQIRIEYRRKGDRECKTYQGHPLALIQRGSVIYLFARLSDYANTVLLALHRIEKISVLDELPAEAPPGFDLDSELAKGRLGFGNGASVEVQLRFYDGKGAHLFETPLAQDQCIVETPDQKGELTVTATVADTPQLRWWILGFGDGVEVLRPESMRQEISQMALSMTLRYK